MGISPSLRALSCTTKQGAEALGKHVHKLSEVDPEEKTALCAHCGPTVLVGVVGGFRCRGSQRSHRHKLTLAEAHAMKKDARCGICGATDNLKIDHSHSSGDVRGVLCHGCNIGLGNFRDDPDLLRKAIRYLAKANKSC